MNSQVKFHHRIGTIYAKELTDILRDRRTLIAMILVPIILYPLLMLGSIQAVSYQAVELKQESLLIGVVNDEHRLMISELIRRDAMYLQKMREMAGENSPEADELPTSLTNSKIIVFNEKDALLQSVQSRDIHLGVIFDQDNLEALNDYALQVHVQIPADMEEVRSSVAYDRVYAMLDRTQDRLENKRLDQEGLPRSFVEPFTVETVDLSSPPSILGQILPLILVLMTITGAIYPAIDLTAGERERGTLESLMVTPVPVFDLIVGKFLVVTTVAIMGAALNLASVSATVYFGGFDKVISQTGGSIPYAKMGLILLALVPFAVFMSAIMIAVCSYARTFKEAQNYVTPVIMAVLIPGGIAALPATRLDGIMLVMPVGNMVLLSRDFLLGATVPAGVIAMVLISTTLYAMAAVGVAASIFGRESVVFADAGSLRNVFSRSLMRPAKLPGVSMSLLIVSLLFPTWFFIQSSISPDVGETARNMLHQTGWLLPVMFVVLPICIMAYWKVSIRNSLGLSLPKARYFLAAICIGLTAWIPAHEISVVQQRLLGSPHAVMDSFKVLQETLEVMPTGMVILLIAIIPAICEELLFRGFLLRGLSASSKKWVAILVAASIFGIFHFMLFRFAITASLGVVLGYLCWQSRSVLPCILAHLLHNTISVMSVLYPGWAAWIGITSEDPLATQQNSDAAWAHLPSHVLIVGGIIFVFGLWYIRNNKDHAQANPTIARTSGYPPQSQPHH